MSLTKIGDFLKRSKIPVDIEDNKEYKRVTIRINHNGVSLRDIEIGKKIGTKKQFVLNAGQFILSKIDARYGAFGIAPSEVNGAIITGNFWAYNVDKKKVNIEWFNQFTNSPVFYDVCERASSGITHRKYLNESFFLNYEILLPSVEEQLLQIENIKEQKISFGQITTEITHQLDLVKQLRQAFLREAMQGKLTAKWRTENPDVEPASELLKKIKAEKEKLVKVGKLKKDKPLPPIKENEIPFEIPVSWEWCRLGEILKILTDYHANGAYEKLKDNVSMSDEEDYAIMLRTTNFHKKNYYEYKYISQKAYNFLEKSKVYAGDLIMNKIGDPGTVFFVDERGKPMSLAMNLFLLRLNCLISNYYIYSYLNLQQGYIKSFSAGTTSMTITKDAVKELLVPLPPLSEQNCIVQKLDELIQTSYKLEESIKTSQQQNEMLLQQVLREALEPNEIVEL